MSSVPPRPHSRRELQRLSLALWGLAVALSALALWGCEPSGLEPGPAVRVQDGAAASSAGRTFRSEPGGPFGQAAVLEGREATSCLQLLSELRRQKHRPFTQIPAPVAERWEGCPPLREARSAPLRGISSAGLPEAGRVAHFAQGPPGSC